MSANPVAFPSHPLAAAFRVAADAIDAEMRKLQMVQQREETELLTRDEACALLKISASLLYKLTAGKNCRRRFGTLIRYERSGLLALARRG